ncbi:MAG: PilZ domain-containing protein [Desulfobacteraceae bacterium]|nr:PilZ domain-containing protein [Desulfobacteraceae bacterium]
MTTESPGGRLPAGERRRHQRFKVPERTLAITPNIIGQIIDISVGGCELKYIENNGPLDSEGTMDILMHSGSFFMEQVPIALAWQDRPQSSALSNIIIRKIGVRFSDLTHDQEEKIGYFIRNHTLGVA